MNEIRDFSYYRDLTNKEILDSIPSLSKRLAHALNSNAEFNKEVAATLLGLKPFKIEDKPFIAFEHNDFHYQARINNDGQRTALMVYRLNKDASEGIEIITGDNDFINKVVYTNVSNGGPSSQDTSYTVKMIETFIDDLSNKKP